MSGFIDQLRGGVNARDLGILALGIERAVVQSAEQRPQRMGGVTEAELKRRAEWCVNTALELMRERRWSSERVVDTLPSAIIAWLDQGEWKPPERAAWFGSE